MWTASSSTRTSESSMSDSLLSWPHHSTDSSMYECVFPMFSPGQGASAALLPALPTPPPLPPITVPAPLLCPALPPSISFFTDVPPSPQTVKRPPQKTPSRAEAVGSKLSGLVRSKRKQEVSGMSMTEESGAQVSRATRETAPHTATTTTTMPTITATTPKARGRRGARYSAQSSSRGSSSPPLRRSTQPPGALLRFVSAAFASSSQQSLLPMLSPPASLREDDPSDNGRDRRGGGADEESSLLSFDVVVGSTVIPMHPSKPPGSAITSTVNAPHVRTYLLQVQPPSAPPSINPAPRRTLRRTSMTQKAAAATTTPRAMTTTTAQPAMAQATLTKATIVKPGEQTPRMTMKTVPTVTTAPGKAAPPNSDVVITLPRVGGGGGAEGGGSRVSSVDSTNTADTYSFDSNNPKHRSLRFRRSLANLRASPTFSDEKEEKQKK